MNAIPASLRMYRDDLVGAIDRELERPHPARLRRAPWASKRRILLAGAAVTGTVLLALIVAAPWQGNPTLLERAEAALLVPGGDQILHESISVQSSTTGYRRSATRVNVWLDGALSHRFRITFSGSRKAEVGGTLGSTTGLYYAASDNVLHPWHFLWRVRQSDLDPATFIRAAIREGRAEFAGRTTLHGTRVIRFRVSEWFETPRGRLLVPVALYYVDAKTYRPVRVAINPPQAHHLVILSGTLTQKEISKLPPDTLVIAPENPGRRLRLGFPLDPSFFLVGEAGYPTPTLPPHAVYDFEDYRLVAPAPGSHTLASVRAMHPHAKRH